MYDAKYWKEKYYSSVIGNIKKRMRTGYDVILLVVRQGAITPAEYVRYRGDIISYTSAYTMLECLTARRVLSKTGGWKQGLDRRGSRRGRGCSTHVSYTIDSDFASTDVYQSLESRVR